MCCCARSVLTRDPSTDTFRWGKIYEGHDSEGCNPTDLDNFRITTSFRWTITPGTVHSDSPDQIDSFLDGLPLRLHLERLKASVHAFGWTQALEIFMSDSLEVAVRLGLLEHMRSATLHVSRRRPGEISLSKVRLAVSKGGKLEIQDSGPSSMKPPIYPFSFASNPFRNFTVQHQLSSKVAVAEKATEPSIFTQRKTTHRPMYEEVHASMIKFVKPPTTAEVLLYNTSGEIMEATVSTAYFCQGDGWITPASKCGGNLGTTRALALDKGWCKEGTVSLEEVRNMHGQVMWLSNAVRGFWPARICVDEEEWKAHLLGPNLLRG